MKSTYKLLNIYLDGQPLPVESPEVMEYVEMPDCNELEDETTLFDFPVCRRKVSGMRLLSYLSETDIFETIDILPNCRELIIILDFSSSAQAAYKLYLKRILQTAYLIMKKYPDITVIFVGNSIDNSIIKQFYQDKTILQK